MIINLTRLFDLRNQARRELAQAERWVEEFCGVEQSGVRTESAEELRVLSGLVEDRNRCRLELARRQEELDAFSMAIAINAREASAQGSGIAAPARPEPLPRRVREMLERRTRPEGRVDPFRVVAG